jgi:hypothetical protein
MSSSSTSICTNHTKTGLKLRFGALCALSACEKKARKPAVPTLLATNRKGRPAECRAAMVFRKRQLTLFLG